jgi:hypothetical protein
LCHHRNIVYSLHGDLKLVTEFCNNINRRNKETSIFLLNCSSDLETVRVSVQSLQGRQFELNITGEWHVQNARNSHVRPSPIFSHSALPPPLLSNSFDTLQDLNDEEAFPPLNVGAIARYRRNVRNDRNQCR